MPYCLLVSEEIKFLNKKGGKKGGPVIRLGAGGLHEFNHAKQSSR